MTDPRAPHESGIGSNATWQAPPEALPRDELPGVALCASCRTYRPAEDVHDDPETGLRACSTCRPDLAPEPETETPEDADA